MENFTIHPATPPVYLSPVLLKSGAYALKLPYYGDDLSRSPYIAALINTASPGTVGLKTVYVPGPGLKGESGQIVGCPKAYQCVTDAFSVYDGEDGGKKLGYAGFEGGWRAVKDAAPEGWRAYWVRGVVGESGSIEIEIVAKGERRG